MKPTKFPEGEIQRSVRSPFDYYRFAEGKEPKLIEPDILELAAGICKDACGRGRHYVEIHSKGIMFTCSLIAYLTGEDANEMDWSVTISDIAFTIGETAKEIPYKLDHAVLEREVEQIYEL